MQASLGAHFRGWMNWQWHRPRFAKPQGSNAWIGPARVFLKNAAGSNLCQGVCSGLAVLTGGPGFPPAKARLPWMAVLLSPPLAQNACFCDHSET